jgi:WhiB family redox-sensing transcriptional regulator
MGLPAIKKEDAPNTFSVFDTSPSEMNPEIFDVHEWSKESRCIGIDDSMFYEAASSKMAKVICKRCPVKTNCLIWAAIYKEEGVWGGMTETERKRELPQDLINALIERAKKLNLYFQLPTSREIIGMMYPNL